jgi:hypothetical protein
LCRKPATCSRAESVLGQTVGESEGAYSPTVYTFDPVAAHQYGQMMQEQEALREVQRLMDAVPRPFAHRLTGFELATHAYLENIAEQRLNKEDLLYVYWDPDVSGPMFKLTVVWAVGVAYPFEALLPSFWFFASHPPTIPRRVARHLARGGMAPRSSYRT